MSALLTRYRIALTHDETTFDVEPVQDDIVLQWIREQDQIFYRQRIKNSLLLRGADYVTLKAIEDGTDRCLPILIEIFALIPGAADELRATGVTYLDDADFDEDRCEVVLKVEEKDNYGRLTRIWEKTVNILSGTTKVVVRTNFADIGTPISEIEEFEDVETITIDFPGSDTFTESGWPDLSEGWVITSDQVTVDSSGPPYSATRTVRFAREITLDTYLITDPPPPGDFLPGAWSGAVEVSPGVFKYVREIASYEIEAETTTTTNYFGIIPGNWTYDAYLKRYSYIPKDFPYFQNGVTLAAVFTKLLTGSGITLKSNIFNINPSGASPSNEVYDDGDHHDMVVFNRSDIQLPDASDPATRLDMTLKGLLDTLKNTFQVYPSMDEDTLVLEHISFYEDQEGIDFTVAPYDISLIGRSSYQYDRQNAPIGEAFIQAEEEPCQLDFKRWEFSYDIPVNGDGIPLNCITRPGPIKETVAGDLCCDVQRQVAVPDLFTTNGFTIINTFTHDGDRFIDGFTFRGTANYRMTPYYLLKYWKAKRYFAHGIDDDGYLYFTDLIKTKRQAEISVRLEDITDFNPIELQKTNYGWGEPYAPEYSLKTGVLKLQIVN
jgi:hypothetical protein